MIPDKAGTGQCNLIKEYAYWKTTLAKAFFLYGLQEARVMD
jgi:hypothetical protein